MSGRWNNSDRKMFRLYILVLLAYIGVSYLLICVHVAPPFTLIGEVKWAENYSLAPTITVLLFILFLLLGAIARFRCRSEDSIRRVLAIGFLVLLAGILTVAVYEFVTAWTTRDISVRKTAECSGTGMLGIGWGLLTWLVWKATREWR